LTILSSVNCGIIIASTLKTEISQENAGCIELQSSNGPGAPQADGEVTGADQRANWRGYEMIGLPSRGDRG
jgi:hypothetical protein